MARRYVHSDAADDPVVQYDGAAVGAAYRTYLMPDERGSIAGLSYDNGTSRAKNSYDEYGIPGAANQGRFQYTGQAWIPELGMYHYKARLYSPTLGRFMQVDPIGYEGGINIYAYVGDDPVNGSDPSGLYKCSGNTTECKTINGYVKEIQLAARLASHSSGAFSAEAKALNSLSKFIGNAGVENGVTIASADLPRRVYGAHTSTGPGSTLIELDLSKIGRSKVATGAGVLAHEATHGAQERLHGPMHSLSNVYRREFTGNAMESIVNQQLKQSTMVWSPTMSASERVRRIREAANMSCELVRQNNMDRFGGQVCGN